MSLLDNAPILTELLRQLPRATQERALLELVSITQLERAEAFVLAAQVSREWTSLDDVRWELDVRAKAERTAELASVKGMLRLEPWKASPQTGRSTRERAPVAVRPRDSVNGAGSERRGAGVTAGETALPVGEAATLRALIQYAGGLERRQLTVITGYKRSTRDAYIARLRERGFVMVLGERVAVTDAGIAAMPDAEPLPTGTALQDHWLKRLPSGEGTILAKLLEVNGDDFGREDLSEATGFKRSTRDAYISRLAAKELVVDVGRGFVKASPTLFEVQP